MTSPPDSAGYAGARRGARILVTLISVLAGLLSVGPNPAAYWGQSGSGSAVAVTGTLASPVGVIVPATASPEVAVTWSEGVGGIRPSGLLDP